MKMIRYNLNFNNFYVYFSGFAQKMFLQPGRNIID
jgi:hypothetical protein